MQSQQRAKEKEALAVLSIPYKSPEKGCIKLTYQTMKDAEPMLHQFIKKNRFEYIGVLILDQKQWYVYHGAGELIARVSVEAFNKMQIQEQTQEK